MKIVTGLLKNDLKDLRDEMARKYREIRRENPAKARFLRSKMKLATDMTERALLDNVYEMK